MSIARPFAYNTGSTINGTIQVGDLAVGTPTSGFSSTGLPWWNGPDEELGFIIAGPVPSNTQPTPISGVTASVQFWRSAFTDSSFVDLAEYVTGQSFTGGSEASTYLTTNGYWNSYTYNQVIVGLDTALGFNTGYSYDGLTWYSGNTSSAFAGSVRALSSNGSMWVIGGLGGSKAIGYSYDGLNWTGMTNSSLLGGYCDDFYWDGTKWFAVGNLNPLTSEALATSTDGITWTANTTLTSIGAISSIVGNGSRYVAGGSVSPYFAYSNDGETWSAATSGSTGIVQNLSLATNGSIFVAANNDNGTGAVIKYSYDGNTWFNSNANTIFGTGTDAKARDVVWNGQFFLAVGSKQFGAAGNAAKSTDGITWTATTAPYTSTQCVAWDGKRFYAGGNNVSTNMAYSTDGNSWSVSSFITTQTSRFAIGTFMSPNTFPPVI
jgi:hypothetical protein